MRMFAHVGLPQVILMDRGSPFTSTLMQRVYQLLGIQQLFGPVQHPQTDGLTERLSQTIKGMLAKAVACHPQSWDLCVDPILFTLRESPQASTGFSPFELLYGRWPRGLLKVLDRAPVPPAAEATTAPDQYVTRLAQHLQTVRQAAQANLGRAQ